MITVRKLRAAMAARDQPDKAVFQMSTPSSAINVVVANLIAQPPRATMPAGSTSGNVVIEAAVRFNAVGGLFESAQVISKSSQVVQAQSLSAKAPTVTNKPNIRVVIIPNINFLVSNAVISAPKSAPASIIGSMH